MRALLDTNILLDVLLNRTPWAADSAAVWSASEAGKFGGCVAAMSIPTIFYIGRKLVGNQKALEGIKLILESFELVGLDRAVLEAAMLLPGSDYEDNVQIATALAGGMDYIVTRDPRGFARGPCPPMEPLAFIRILTL